MTNLIFPACLWVPLRALVVVIDRLADRTRTMNVDELRRQELSSVPTPFVGTGVAERASFTSRYCMFA